MSAPRRRRLRNQVVPTTIPRRQRFIAIGGSALIVLVTVVLIWAMRPGSFTPGSGGIIHRQPRATWWVIATIAAIAFSVWLIRRPTAAWKKPKLVIGICAALIVAGAPLAAAKWPGGGILRHYPTFATEPKTTPSVPRKPTTKPSLAKAPTSLPFVTRTTAARSTTTPVPSNSTTTSVAPTTTT